MAVEPSIINILPQFTAFSVGALFSLIKETQEKRSKKYWIALAINSVLIFSGTEVSRFILEKNHGKIPGVVVWCLFLAVGILSNMLSDVIANTERWIEDQRVNISDVLALIRKTDTNKKDEKNDKSD